MQPQTVGLLAGQNPAFLAAFFGILEAGDAALVLPLTAPDSRLEFMLTDCGARTIVTDATRLRRALALAARVAGVDTVVSVDPLPGDLEPVAGVAVVCAEVAEDDGAAAAPLAPVDPSTPAYVIYTSGTTGVPKGVAISHANVMPLLFWQKEHFGVGPETRMAQTLALSFDFGLQEIFTSVVFGGALCFPAESERYSAEGYAAFVARDRVNTLFLTPTFADDLVRGGAALDAVTLVLLGGEVLTAETVRSLAARVAPDCRLWNGYGPTEVSINTSMHLASVGTDGCGVDTGIVPIGRSSGHAQQYVLDAYGNRVPPLLLGEVFLGGPGVAAGYINRPELTAAAFRDDPFAPGGRMYRSGDLGWVRLDGRLVIVGRRDGQVKIRGYRVEIAEVEAVIRRHPGVHECVVVVDGAGRARRLVAFVVLSPGTASEAVGRFAAEVLPTYMVPGRFVTLDALPLSTNGKVDRAQLVVPSDPLGASSEDAFVAAVVETWAEMLNAARIGPEDTFFGLGGHSLLVVAMLARIEARLGLPRIPVHKVFEHSTVRAFAGYLAATSARGSDAGAAPLPRPEARRRRAGGRGRLDVNTDGKKPR